MDVMQSVENIKTHLESFAHDAVAKLEQDLPVVADVASKTASNPVFAALAAAVHLNAAPEALATLAQMIQTMDAALGNAKAAGAAELEAQLAAEHAAQVPPEPAQPQQPA